MLKHIVMWRLHDRDKAGRARQVKQKLEALQGRVPGLLKIEVGIDISGSSDAADCVLYSEFADRAALENYLRHPEHQALKPFMAGAWYERRVVDYET